MIFEYPLKWPIQQPRTTYKQRARFGNHSQSKAGDYLINELERMGGRKTVISSNLQKRQRNDGFLTNQRVDDPGVVIYFQLKGQPKAMACDKYDKPEHNLWALYLSVQAIRGLERWGGSEMINSLFTGFKALPSPEDAIITSAQYFSEFQTKLEAKERYRTLCKELHPDVGGGANEFNEMRRQYELLL